MVKSRLEPLKQVHPVMSDPGVQMKTNRRAQAIVNRLLGEKKLTAEGLAWLTLATDPFHDTDIQAMGYPDLNTCNSITQCFTLTQTIRAPSTAVGGIWDAHVFFNPISRLEPMISGPNETVLEPMNFAAKTGEVFLPVLGGARFNSGFNVVSMPAGLTYVDAGATQAAASLSYPRSGSTGQFRLVGAGFEVVNTTPVLQRGGSVTCYRQPSHTNARSCSVWVANVNDYQQQVNTFMLPPLSQSEAQLIPTSKTWGAEDGVYSVCAQSSEINPFLVPMGSLPFQQLAPSLSDLSPLVNRPAYTYRTAIVNGSRGSTLLLAKLLPYDLNGSIFTGLSPETTLQVTVKYYIERIPTVNDPDLLVLSRPSPQYDPMAVEIFSKTLSELPVAVKVGENPLGEWFNDILDVVSEFAPSLGAVFGPMGAAAGATLGAGAKSWRNTRAVPSTTQFTLGPAPAPPVPAPRMSSQGPLQGPKRPPQKKKKRNNNNNNKKQPVKR